MHQLIFATNNSHKVKEIKSVVDSSIHIISLAEAGINIDIPEPHNSLLANAREKSSVIHQLTKQNCFSEDTGLEVDALDGDPGVNSARYAGDSRDFRKNIDLLLYNLAGKTNRSAQFRTVVSLIWDEKEYFFEGICIGQITETENGQEGFGYDPIFIPDGSTKTFAAMSMEEKNNYSHRKKAIVQLVTFLKNIQ